MPLPERPFPAYSYVPGKFPHPLRDRAGHSFGQSPEPCQPLTPENSRQHDTYLWGIQLFNQGYYWEAHEVWEQVWHASGRQGMTADYLKGLIKLAAAGVKTREGRPEGVRRHATRSAELFLNVRSAQQKDDDSPFGLSLTRLIQLAEHVAVHSGELVNISDTKVEVTLPAL